jgi:hypothetical protein
MRKLQDCFRVSHGFVAALLLAGMVGDTVGGLIADRILVHTNNLTLARKLLAVPTADRRRRF